MGVARVILAIATPVLVIAVTQSAWAQQPSIRLSAGYASLTYVTSTFDVIYICVRGPCIGGPGKAHATDSDHGWYVDVAGGVGRHFAIVGKTAATYANDGGYFTNANPAFSGSSTYQFLGGGRFQGGFSSKFLAFGHLLGGRARSMVNIGGTSETATGNVLNAGGGLDLMFSNRVGFRAGIDYVRFFIEGISDDTASFTFGIVFAK